MWIDAGIAAIKALTVIGMVVGLAGILGWVERKGSALIQDRIGANRGSAQMISYEIGMGLSIVAMVMTYGSLDLQHMVRAQGYLIGGWVPAWGVLYQPVAFLIFLCAGIA